MSENKNKNKDKQQNIITKEGLQNLEKELEYLKATKRKEVSERTDVPAYTLRYWEKEFKQLKPQRFSRIRKYSPLDVELVKQIKDLLYNKKYTIDGVKKCLNVDRRKKNTSSDIQTCNSKFLLELKQEIKEILDILK